MKYADMWEELKNRLAQEESFWKYAGGDEDAFSVLENITSIIHDLEKEYE